MKVNNGNKHYLKSKKLRHLLMMFLCLIMVFSICDTSFVSSTNAIESSKTNTQEEIKTRLLRQIKEENWDPYSSDMSIDEFYALMELFEEGTLPLKDEDSKDKSDTPSVSNPPVSDPSVDEPGIEEGPSIDEPSMDAPDVNDPNVSDEPSIGDEPSADNPGVEDPGLDEPSIEEPSIDDPTEDEPSTGDTTPTVGDFYIPRTMFMFSGIRDDYEGENQPLPYDNEKGAEDELDAYPAGLDNYGLGYKLPYKEWNGVKVNNEMEAIVIVPNANDGDPTITGDVDQELFPEYDNYYVRRVTVQNAEVDILGAIKLSGSDEYVYYYVTSTDQSTEVSTTTLSKSEKFIVEYSIREHHMNYVVEMHDTDANGNVLDTTTVVTDMESDENAFGSNQSTVTWVDGIFGTDRPTATVDGAYSFNVTVPYGYELRLYRIRYIDNGERQELTGKEPPQGMPIHNEGYPLGMDPVYDKQQTDFRITTTPENSPSTLTMRDTFYNNSVTSDRIIIAVLKKKDEPRFDATIVTKVAGAKERGTSAKNKVDATLRGTDIKEKILYDYEDEYFWFMEYKDKVEEYKNRSKYINYDNANAIGNIQTADGWNWGNTGEGVTYSKMDKNEDGTYSYQWTWQTNSSDEYMMDVLEINGVAIRIPFLPKYTYNIDEKQSTDSGINAWFTETKLSDGTQVRVEYLMYFNTGKKPQRVYRIIITNARSNVVVTGLNLMQYASGAPEISVYDLVGIYADNDDTSQTAAIQYYDELEKTWKKTTLSNVIVNQNKTDKTKNGIDYDQGDGDHYGANIRFKLADGYDSPYYLFESSRDGTIDKQASAERDDEGNVIKQNDIQKISDVVENNKLDSQYIYDGGDGWYYIRLTGQDPYKMALLTIVAKPVRYAVRYVPTFPNGKPSNLSENSTVGIVKNPDNMPQFEHTDECHDSFYWDTNNGISGEQYDDANGKYYDTVEDTVVRVPNTPENLPVDPSKQYVFVDWVLVDEDYLPVTDKSGNELHFFGQVMNIVDVNEYAIKNDALGGSDVDVYVLRLMPTWRKIDNPFNYNVRLKWIDAQGELHDRLFQGDWRDTLTDWDIQDGGLTVKVLTDSTPLQDWIAQHPTYTFWDDVNNATGTEEEEKQKIIDALKSYIPELNEDSQQENYQKAVDALLEKDISGNGDDDFTRLGNYAFQVNEDEGTIVIWMYENKGGLIFHKDVLEEPLIYNDEFYFTVSRVNVTDEALLEGTYKAYSEHVYDDSGKERFA